MPISRRWSISIVARATARSPSSACRFEITTNEVIGILQLVNAQSRRTGAIVPFSEEDQRLAESLASQAAVALTKNRLVEDFKGLFEGMTDLISTAIDEQSPHTGGHVRRVVVLSTMIAEAMSRSPNRAVRDRALSSDELYELRIAALLHDCGKLTTPVHLTDKRTKLQGIFDRMRLVEARSETVRRQKQDRAPGGGHSTVRRKRRPRSAGRDRRGLGQPRPADRRGSGGVALVQFSQRADAG